jgi:putative SOS response-associated peptidase YedK
VVHRYDDGVCGRVVTVWSATRLAAYFDATISYDDGTFGPPDRPRYNVAPTHALWTLIMDRDEHRLLVPCRWGLIPSWAKDVSGASKLINARSESLFDRPTYRPLLARHRCVVPVDGFYEWGPGKRPQFIHDPSDTPVELAGLWTTWRSPEGDRVRTCTVLTTEATGPLAEVHHRMPVALDPVDTQAWLHPEPLHPDEIGAVVERARHRATQRWRWHEVSRAVNKVGEDHAGLIALPTPESAQGQLFSG